MTGYCEDIRAICQKGTLEPKNHPSKASETQVRFLRCALSTRGPCVWKYVKNRYFWAKNALFRTILYHQGLCGGENGVFFPPNNLRAPLASIPIRFGPIGDIFFWRSLKSFFCLKPLPWKFLRSIELGRYCQQCSKCQNCMNVPSER